MPNRASACIGNRDALEIVRTLLLFPSRGLAGENGFFMWTRCVDNLFTLNCDDSPVQEFGEDGRLDMWLVGALTPAT